MTDWRVVSDIDYILHHNARLRHDHNRPMGSNGCIFTQFAHLYMPYTSSAGLLHYTVTKLEPGFEGVQTQNPGLNTVVGVWNP